MALPSLDLIVGGVLEGSLYALLGMGLTLILGVMKIVNLAQGDFLMLGGYITFWLFLIFGIDPAFSFAAAMFLLFVVGYIIQRYIITRGVRVVEFQERASVLLTYGLSLFIASLATVVWTGDSRVLSPSYALKSIIIGGIFLNIPRLAVLFMTPVIAVILYLILTKTAFGRAIRAVSQDRISAQLLGINFSRVAAITFGLATAEAALAGTMYAMTHNLTPSIGLGLTLRALTVVVLGGFGSVMGALIGGIALGVIESVGSFYLTVAYRDAITFIVLLIVLLIRPKGLFGVE